MKILDLTLLFINNLALMNQILMWRWFKLDNTYYQIFRSFFNQLLILRLKNFKHILVLFSFLECFQRHICFFIHLSLLIFFAHWSKLLKLYFSLHPNIIKQSRNRFVLYFRGGDILFSEKIIAEKHVNLIYQQDLRGHVLF